MENESNQSENKTISRPDYYVLPIAGKNKVVKEDYYSCRSYFAGHKMANESDYVEIFDKFIKILKSKEFKGKVGFDFNEFFKVIAMEDYRNPEFYSGLPTDAPLDKSVIAPLSSLTKSDEICVSFAPIESDWYGVAIAKKDNPGTIVRVVFLSNSGYAIESTDIRSFLERKVPEQCYLKDSSVNGIGFIHLDISYFDGTHEDFLMDYFNKSLSSLYSLWKTFYDAHLAFAISVNEQIEEVKKAFNRGRAEAQKRKE